MSFAVKDAQIKREHDEDENVEPDPEPEIVR